MSGLVTKSQFADILGCTRPYISQLVRDSRLVLADDGRRVDVDASLDLLGATSDPSKLGVRERWAAFRAAQHDGAAPAPPASPAPVAAVPVVAPIAAEAQQSLISDHVAPDPLVDAPTKSRSEYQEARTLREQSQAALAQIELMKARGQVLAADGALRAVADAHIGVRTELMSFADRLTPLVAAETQSRKVWEIINTECERLAQRMQATAQRMASQCAEALA